MVHPAEPRPERLWWAIGIGTLLQLISYGAIIVGVVAAASEEEIAAGPAFALGFLLVPAVCASVAFISRHERAPMATLKGMGLWIVVGLPLGLVNPVAGIASGFVASGAVTLRPTVLAPGRARTWAVVLTTSYLFALVLILPQAAMLAGALTPLLAVRAADIYSERAESRRDSAA